MSDQHWSQIMLPRERIEQLENVNRELREENERARQANLHTMDVFEDMKVAMEKAEARVVELELAYKDATTWEDVGDVFNKTTSIPWLLRKQAQAVEPAIRTSLRNLGNADISEDDIERFASGYADRLRRQAYDIEND